MSPKQNDSGAPASKKIRMTMACERCRSKKVKCDFTHPQCARCQQAKAECSYDGNATQVDLFNLVKLNETVDILQKRVQSIETDIKDVRSNTQYVANEVRMNSNNKRVQSEESGVGEREETSSKRNMNSVIPRSSNMNDNSAIMNNLLTASNTQWSLSLTSKGLRIDTNIVSMHNLYDILLSGVNQFDLSHTRDDNSSISCCPSINGDSPRAETATMIRKKPFWKYKLKTFPLYSSWESDNINNNSSKATSTFDYNQDLLKEMIYIFEECFLCLPFPDASNSILTRFNNNTLDPLLANSIFAWTARHAAIYHDSFPGKDPNQVGQSFFLKAKELVKDRFMKTTVDTMHSLIIMYIYAIGMPINKSHVESEAYIYLGIAIRMCLDLKMNQESTSNNEFEREANRRFFWANYFLETLGSIHSERPFLLPPKNMITVQFPTLMKHEAVGETQYRVEFMIERFKISRIYKNIIHKTLEEKPLLSQISLIDKELRVWQSELPDYMKYEYGDINKRNWKSTSFKEQACIKLNMEYNFQLCQLHALFFNQETPSQQETVEVLSRDICLKAARNIVELLECWIQLKQRWCHFSLENLMMVTVVYGNSLSRNDDPDKDIAKQNLEKIAKILLQSPVRHHKYVLTLTNRIKDIFKDTLGKELHINARPLVTDNVGKEKVKVEKNSTPPAHISLSQPSTSGTSTKEQQQPSTLLPSPPSSMINMSSINTTAAANNNIQSIPLTIQFVQPPQRSSMFNIMDASPSAFDMHKANTFAEEIHFSDFVYTPTILNYSTSMDPKNFGKNPNYTAPPDTANTGSTYIQQHYSQQQYSAPPSAPSIYQQRSTSQQPWTEAILHNQDPYMKMPYQGNEPSEQAPPSGKPYFENNHPPYNGGNPPPYY